MIIALAQDLFLVKIPLPASPLRDVNCYVLKTRDRNLVIDTGFNNHECRDALINARQELDLDWGRTDFFITHLHADHFGLVGRLASVTSKVYSNRFDRDWFFAWGGFEAHARYLVGHGFPQALLADVSKSYADIGDPAGWLRTVHCVEDGDFIDMGRFNLTCVHTPGHGRGHMCLYEPNLKVLFSGDHLLADISPIIMCYSDRENPLKHYMKSLDKTRKLEVERTYPGHRGRIDDHRKVIDILRIHHDRRLSEILDILSYGRRTGYEISELMKWDDPSEACRDTFPSLRKWFALSEAIAHIRYLEDEGYVSRFKDREQVYFQRVTVKKSY